MMAAQVSINVYWRFRVFQGEMFHPFGCILKPAMGRANLTALRVLLKDMQAERLLLLIQLYETQLNCISFCNEKLTVLGSDEHNKMLNRLFFLSAERKH